MSIIEKLFKSLSRELKKSAKSPPNRRPTPKTKAPISASFNTFIKHQDFLNARWAEAGRLAENNNITSFGEWYYDDPTAAQLNKIKSLELFGLVPQSKGAASDLIGLFSEPSQEDKEFLQFFKAYRAGMTETHAREALRAIKLDPNYADKWNARPPMFEHKVFFKLTDQKPSTVKTAIEAEKLINEMCQESPKNQAIWGAINNLWSDLQDKETREDYDLKAVSKTIFLNTVGAYLDQLEDFDDYDFGEFAECLIDAHPDLERDS